MASHSTKKKTNEVENAGLSEKDCYSEALGPV
jgi:hypothetical protein